MTPSVDFPPPPSLCDVAVVMPTVLRPSVLRAVESVFAQDIDGTVHLLIGVDVALGERTVIEDIAAKRPDNVFVTVLDPGYSTSVRHGGMVAARDGGALRTVLSYMAQSRYVAYLDDDNWWAADHLSTLLAAVKGKAWAFSKRWFIDPKSSETLCEDEWESIGPGEGIFLKKFGGWADPNTIMVDRGRCEAILRLWCFPMAKDKKGMSADRRIFDALKKLSWGATNQASVYYRPDPMDAIHPQRWSRIEKKLGK